MGNDNFLKWLFEALAGFERPCLVTLKITEKGSITIRKAEHVMNEMESFESDIDPKTSYVG